ncbi:MAG: hypothetical protein WDN02_13145 [Methylovirgula sp.]|uniref:hypothetical protein n=1 Tax=Methylovirgula sp. TaxID=1978224 RepID=UPI003076632E
MTLAIFVLALIAIVAFVLFMQARATKRRRAELFSKYGNLEVVEAIMAHRYWQGMTQDQLLDSLGRPADIGTKVFKSKTVHTFKYQQTGRNRFGLRILLENGSVTGWDQK